MKLYIGILILLCLCFTPPVLAKTPGKRKPTQKELNAMTRTRTIPFKIIEKHLKKGLPSKLCEKQGKLRSCLKLTGKTCQKVVKSSVYSCVKKKRTKNLLTTVEMVNVSGQIGQCVKDRIVKKVPKRKSRRNIACGGF